MAQDPARFDKPAAEKKLNPIREGHEPPPPPLKTAAPAMDSVVSYQELERRYRHRTYQAQELMVEKLLRGHYIVTEGLEHKLNMFDLHFDAPQFMVALVRPAGNDQNFVDYASDLRDGGQVGLIVSSIFSELLGEHYSCYPTNLDDRYAFLLNLTSSNEEETYSVVGAACRDAVKFIHDNFMLDLHVCVSGICTGLYPLHEMFRETDMVSGDNNTVYTDGVCVRAEGGASQGLRKPEPSIEKQYLNALVTQDFQTALQLTLERVRAVYNDGGAQDLDRVRMFLNMRLHTTSSVLTTPPEIFGGDPQGGDPVLRLDYFNSLEEIEQMLTQLFSRLDAHFNTTPSDYTGTTGKVINLISKKYMEPDLSVEMICDCLGKSRSYLSRMFKENTGMNLLDYLHTTRLTEAKKLLNETDLGISEIAAKVGYYSGWTLARVFKRYEGITPTAYRKAFCNNAEA